MTRRERIEAVINLEEPDRVPVYDLLRNDSAIEYYSGKHLNIDNGLEITCEAIGKALDMTRSIRGPAREEIVKKNGFVYEVKRWTTWVKKRPFSNVREAAAWVEKDIKEKNAWQPNKEYIKTFRSNFLNLQEKVGDTVILLTQSPVGLDPAYIWLGLDLFIYLYAENPKLVSSWLESLNLLEIRRAHAIADYTLSPVTLVFSDIAFKDKVMFSPKFLKKEFYPRLKRLVEAYHEHKIKCLFHSDGNLMEILPDLVATGIDGLNPIEVTAGMSLRKIKELYGDKLFLAGGIDVSQLMVYGTKKEIEETVIQAIKDAGLGSGFFVGSTTELHNAIPGENIVTMIETTKKYGKYPLNL